MSDINQENGKETAVKSETKSRRTHTAVELAKCALFVVIMAISAQIKIPIPYLPLTFQTIAAVLAGLLLGSKWGTISVLIYMFMGLLGLPVFAGGAGGFNYVLQLSFGYVVGFVAAAFVAGFVTEHGTRSFKNYVWAALLGVVANYIIGVPYFMCMWVFYYHNEGALNALLMYNAIYFPKDLVLGVLGAVLANRVFPIVNRSAVTKSEK